LIAIGLVRPHQRAAELIRALLSRGQHDTNSLALAGWSLVEDIQVEADLRQTVRQDLLAGLRRTKTAGDFARLSEALLVADAEAAQNWMRATLQGRDPHFLQKVLNLLPGLGAERSQRFIPLLVSLLGNRDETLEARVQAALALGRLGVALDSSGWEILGTARQDKYLNLRAAATWTWCELGRFEILGLVKVPAGSFQMGSDPEKDKYVRDNEQPQHSMYLSTFYIARYPITVAQWRAWVEQSGHKINDQNSLGGADNHPVRYVSWNEVLSYAQSTGMTLPSEAEWEKAARGIDGRIYPWGDIWDSRRANTVEYLTVEPRHKGAETTPVGKFSPAGDSPYGCADMVGNVWELTRSLYRPYPYDTTDGREDFEQEGVPALRGGSFYDRDALARCASRGGPDPSHGNRDYGFRCVVSPVSLLVPDCCFTKTFNLLNWLISTTLKFHREQRSVLAKRVQATVSISKRRLLLQR
jgi:hypothetical protein